MLKSNKMLVLILALGVFGIMNTEMGVVGILPMVAEQYDITVSHAGLFVSLFALVVAISGPILPMVFSGVNRKKVMLISLGVFVLGNIVSVFATSFNVALIARIIPAFFHPVYCSLALTVAATSAKNPEEARKAVTTIIMGVSAGMVLGVPIMTYIANVSSVEMAMVFSTIVNVIAFIATLFLISSMPVKEKVSYGTQLGVLRKPLTWISLFTIIFMTAALAGTNSYTTEYLGKVTHISGNTISTVLFLYGVATIFGNILAGKLLSKNPMKTALLFPILMGVIYIIWFFTGEFIIPMIITMVIYGVMFAIQNNINQYWITSAIPEAPDFANGLFVSSSNWGISIGTAVGGLFLTGMGIEHIVWNGILFLLLCFVSISIRYIIFHPARQLSKQ